jgi:hypothetical protein
MLNTGAFPDMEFQADATADALSFRLSLPIGRPVGAETQGTEQSVGAGRQIMDGEADVVSIEPPVCSVASSNISKSKPRPRQAFILQKNKRASAVMRILFQKCVECDLLCNQSMLTLNWR